MALCEPRPAWPSPANADERPSPERFPSPLVPVAVDDFERCKRHCHDPDFDMQLVMRLIELIGIRARFSLTFAITQKLGATPREVEGAVRVALKCLRMLHLCGYHRNDIVLVVAHASSYLSRLMITLEQAGKPPMEIHELTHVFSALLYVAHSYVLDESCPLRVWHKHLFTKYCSVRTLNSAVFRLLEQLGYVLRVHPEELDERLTALGGLGEDSLLSR